MYTTTNDEKVFFSNGNGRIDPDQPSVVFVHGAGMDHSVWVLPSRYFARHGYNVYALDLPGHGRSAGPALESVDAMADWLKAFMTTLNIDRPALVGHSMGSLVAINFASRHNEMLRALVLLGTSIPMPVADQLLGAAEANDHDAIDMVNTWSHSSFGLIGGNESPGMCMTMLGQRLLERAADDVFYADLAACNDFSNGAQLAAEISVETLVILGEQDKMTAPVGARQVAATIPNSRVVSLSPCGHSMLSEQPNQVIDALASIV